MLDHKFKNKPSAVGGSSDPQPVEEQKLLDKSVFCSHGINSGNFPIAGMKVADARKTLKKLLNISDEAVAVIDGVIVENENEQEVQKGKTLHFVKKAAVKGSVEVAPTRRRTSVLCKKDGTVATPTGSLTLSQFCQRAARIAPPYVSNEALPTGTKWHVRAGDLELFVIQLDPCIRRMEIKSMGDDRYKHRRLALPYVVIFVPVVRGQVQERTQLFYRTEPLRSVNDSLFMPNLLNISPYSYGVRAWMCTQYLSKVLGEGSHSSASNEDKCDAIVKHMFDGASNTSSESNEGSSGFSRYISSGNCPSQVASFDEWERQTDIDPRFMLDIEWECVSTVKHEIDWYIGAFFHTPNRLTHLLNALSKE